jgi:outer membrane receptor protein involved in Fe transport
MIVPMYSSKSRYWPERAVPRAAGVAFAVISASLHVNARAADDDNTTLEEVTVTARYRSESLQDTPISITALKASDLEARA